MITESQLLDAIATAILNKQDLYIDRDAGAAATTSDFAFCAPYDSPAGHDLLFSTDDFIDRCIEEDCEDDDYISASDIKSGWDGEAEMPAWDQIRAYVAACDSNDNFSSIIESLEQMDVLTRDEYSEDMDTDMDTDKISAIMDAASSLYCRNDSESARQERYDVALRALSEELTLPITVDEAMGILNRLVNEIWFTEPINIVSGEDDEPDSIECSKWRHGYAQGYALQRSEDFGHEVLSDLLDLIGKTAEIQYDEGAWYISGIYNL